MDAAAQQTPPKTLTEWYHNNENACVPLTAFRLGHLRQIFASPLLHVFTFPLQNSLVLPIVLHNPRLLRLLDVGCAKPDCEKCTRRRPADSNLNLSSLEYIAAPNLMLYYIAALGSSVYLKNVLKRPAKGQTQQVTFNQNIAASVLELLIKMREEVLKSGIITQHLEPVLKRDDKNVALNTAAYAQLCADVSKKTLSENIYVMQTVAMVRLTEMLLVEDMLRRSGGLTDAQITELASGFEYTDVRNVMLRPGITLAELPQDAWVLEAVAEYTKELVATFNRHFAAMHERKEPLLKRLVALESPDQLTQISKTTPSGMSDVYVPFELWPFYLYYTLYACYKCALPKRTTSK